MCGPCLRVILSEADPGRRRSLAGVTGLPPQVAERLAGDPDAGVRARLATRGDLASDLAARFADPRIEPSPVVWRCLAATPTGASRAESLLSGNDRLTGLILATNPATTPGVLERLARHADAEIVATVEATRRGDPPPSTVISEILDARVIPTAAIGAAPTGTAWPGPPGASSSSLGPSGPDVAVGPSVDDPASHRGLVIGFVAVLVVILVAAVVVVTRGGDRGTVASGGHVVTTSTTLDVRTSEVPSTTSPETTTAATTAPDTGDDAETVSLDLSFAAQRRRFCDSVDIEIVYDAPTASVIVTDDADRELWQGRWPSGTTRTIPLIAPSDAVHATITTQADAATFKPSGSVHGTFC